MIKNRILAFFWWISFFLSYFIFFKSSFCKKSRKVLYMALLTYCLPLSDCMSISRKNKKQETKLPPLPTLSIISRQNIATVSHVVLRFLSNHSRHPNDCLDVICRIQNWCGHLKSTVKSSQLSQEILCQQSSGE